MSAATPPPEAGSPFAENLRAALREVGVARLLIAAFICSIWVVAALATRLSLGPLARDTLVRAGMNGTLVLALVPMVRAGAGLNFGLPLGIVCGLLGALVSLEMRLEGWPGLLAGAAICTPIAVGAGFLYALLLERVRGDEMMVGLYTGFAAVALSSLFWLVAPFKNPEVIWPLGGHGVRNTVSIVSAFFPEPTAAMTEAEKAAAIDWGVVSLVASWLAITALVAIFERTRLGASIAAAGENPRFALAAGISVERARRRGIIFSTWLAAIGILVYSHGYGFLQLYKAPLLMALPAVAALLLGGASTTRASVLHAVLGTLLFQSLLTASLPVVNDLVQQRGGAGADALSNIPEIARLIVGNGVIIYALTRRS